MGVVCGSGARLHALEAVLKVESLAVEAALLAQGSVHLLLLLVKRKFPDIICFGLRSLQTGLQHASNSNSVLATAILNQRTNKRNVDVGINDAKVKDAEENGDIEEEDEDGSEDEDDGGNAEGEDSEDIAEDDEEDDGDVNREERSDDEDDDDDADDNEDNDDADDDEDDGEDGYDDEDEEEDQPPQKRKK